MANASVAGRDIVDLLMPRGALDDMIDTRGIAGIAYNWMSLEEVAVDPQTMIRNRIVTASRAHPAHASFDLIRTKVLQRLRQNRWKSVAITSPRPGCGKSILALNLAFSFAHQTDCRTVVMDLDLKHPSSEKLLGIQNPLGVEAFLRGDCAVNDVIRRFGNNLGIGSNRWPTKYSAELLQSNAAARALQNLANVLNPDVILYDLTSMSVSDDVTAFLPNVDCTILVAEAERSTRDEVDACERHLAERTNFLGVVLNKCRHGALHS
jgi:protein-tyrosine kinase